MGQILADHLEIKIVNREDWLNDCVRELRPSFSVEGFPLPTNIRVSCGFPSTYKRSGTLGEHFPAKASADGFHEVLISPTLDQAPTVLAVLISQLAHAATGKSKGVDYERCVRAMALDGHLNSLTGGSAFITAFEPMLLDLGDYPHGAISTGTKKAQSTRMLSAKCPDCGYQVRLTKKWADKGLPICPTDGEILALESKGDDNE